MIPLGDVNTVPIPDLDCLPKNGRLHGIAIAVYFAFYPEMHKETYFCIERGFFGVKDRVVLKQPFSTPLLNKLGKVWQTYLCADPIAEICTYLQVSVLWFRGNSRYMEFLQQTVKGLEAYKANYEKEVPVKLVETITKIKLVLTIVYGSDASDGYIWLKDQLELDSDAKKVYELWSADLSILVGDYRNDKQLLLKYFNLAQF